MVTAYFRRARMVDSGTLCGHPIWGLRLAANPVTLRGEGVAWTTCWTLGVPGSSDSPTSGRGTVVSRDEVAPDDWRLMGQEDRLRGRLFSLRLWWPYREGWDHDHCEFCTRHISIPIAADGDDGTDRGYVTEDNYLWVCESCFEDFREQFDFRVARGLLR
jgi:hypothetical protein